MARTYTIDRTMVIKTPLANTPIARAIFEKRRRERLTLREAAEATGLSYPTIHRLETHDMLPRVGVAMKVARWLKVDLDDLFPMKSKPKEEAR